MKNSASLALDSKTNDLIRQKLSMRNIIIAICSGDMVHADFTFALLNAVTYSTIHHQEDHRVLGVINRKTSVIKFGRNEMVREAQGIADTTDILMIDTDMTVPMNLIPALLAQNKPIVGIQASTKRPPYKLTARQEDGKWMVGAGVLLIEMDVFKKLAFPWFDDPYDKDGNLTGEDIYFCRKAWASNIPVEIDWEVSKQVYHLGITPHGVK